MKKIFKNLVLALCVLSIITTVLYLFILRFKNVDMTQARLLITYWKEGLISFFVIMVSGVIFNIVSEY